MNPQESFSIGSICSLLGSIPHSVASFISTVITSLWPWHWLWIVLLVGIWIFYEVKTQHGTTHYNSMNGFSPLFNSFVGSVTFAIFQGIVYFLLELFGGEGVYCLKWPFALHLIVFASTGLFLHAIGFWPELRIEGGKKKSKYRRFKKY